MTPNQRVLLAIAAFVAFALASFAWFVSTRLSTDQSAMQTLLLAVNIPGSGAEPQPALSTPGAFA